MAPKHWNILAIEGVPRVLLLAAVGGGAWLTWPVSLWLLGAFATHWALRTFADRLERVRQEGKRGLLAVTAEIGARSLAHAVAYVGVGIFLVAIAQGVLWACSEIIEPRQVRRAEEMLSWGYQSLGHVLDIYTLAAVMGVLVLIACLAPRFDVIKKFLRLKAILSRVVFILLGATSFTFFSTLELERLDPEWRAAERYKARATLDKIDEDTRETLAAAWVENETRRLDPAKQQEFVRLFDRVRSTSAPRAIVRAAAGALAQKAPTVDAKVVNAAATDGQVVSKRLQNYLQSDAPNPELYWTEQPALAELRVANERLSAHELRTRQVRAAAIELAAESIAEIVPKAETELIKAFVQELTSTLSSKALRSVEHIPVGDLASAKRWVRTYLTGKPAAEKGAIAEAWAFYPSGLERSAGSGGARTAEVAISSLVGRLESQEIARQKFDWPRGFPNEVRPSFHPPRGPTIRVRP